MTDRELIQMALDALKEWQQMAIEWSSEDNSCDPPAELDEEDKAILSALESRLAEAGEDEVRYGCHCDLEEGHEPDGCVIDEGRLQDCIHARVGMKKETCPEWKPIKIIVSVPRSGK